MTIQQVWEYGQERGRAAYSGAVSELMIIRTRILSSSCQVSVMNMDSMEPFAKPPRFSRNNDLEPVARFF